MLRITYCIKTFFWATAFLCALYGTGTCAQAPAERPQGAGAPAPETAESFPLEAIQTFVAVLREIRRNYVDPQDDRQLIQKAIKGVLADLDPHSAYLDAAALRQMDEVSTGSYAGLGVEVVYFDGRLRVITPIDGTPASRAGVRAGDVILSIDGRAVPSEQGAEAVEWLRGEPGSVARLLLAREGLAEPLDLAIRREVIKVASVQLEELEPGLVHARIAQFQGETGTELKAKMARYRHRHPLRGMVLDLRSNPGGLLDAAVAVADLFLERGTIVSTRGRAADANAQFEATAGDALNGAPLVVLVDVGTASAAEIVAGALKDQRRAVLMGQRSFGKGSIQTLVPLPSGDAIKITTARYYTPNGVSIQAAGITPDIELTDRVLTVRDQPAAVVTERDLPRHLSAEQTAPAARASAAADTETDYALHEAFHVLKALATLPGKPTG